MVYWSNTLLSLQFLASIYNTHDIHTQSFMSTIIIILVVTVIITVSLLKLLTNRSTSAVFDSDTIDNQAFVALV